MAPLAMLMVILATPGDAHAQSGPAPAVEAPIERARREAEKVYQLILLHADKPRKTREERVVATPAVPRVAPGAAPAGTSTAQATVGRGGVLVRSAAVGASRARRQADRAGPGRSHAPRRCCRKTAGRSRGVVAG